MENQIEFTKINRDINGNPRYVCHFLDLLNNTEKNQGNISDLYYLAIKKAKQLGGKKYHNKSYGGGIVFQSYNIDDLSKRIKELL